MKIFVLFLFIPAFDHLSLNWQTTFNVGETRPSVGRRGRLLGGRGDDADVEDRACVCVWLFYPPCKDDITMLSPHRWQLGGEGGGGGGRWLSPSHNDISSFWPAWRWRRLASSSSPPCLWVQLTLTCWSNLSKQQTNKQTKQNCKLTLSCPEPSHCVLTPLKGQMFMEVTKWKDTS